MIRVKICGLTSREDARAAVAAGADAIGFVFAPSARQVTPTQAGEIARGLPPFIARVGVFVDASLDVIGNTVREAGLTVIQLHGREDNHFIRRVRQLGRPVMKAVAVRDESVVDELTHIEADGLLLDAYDPRQVGGTGKTFDWALALRAQHRLRAAGRNTPVLLAGGLRPDNVRDAVQTVRPYGVDVSSGVERVPGNKCPDKMAQFVKEARG